MAIYASQSFDYEKGDESQTSTAKDKIASTDMPDSTNLVCPKPDAGDSSLNHAFKFILEEDVPEGQLSSHLTNKKAEHSFPREIISSSVAQAEILRPVFGGTYKGSEAYLVRLHFELSGRNKSWFSRIQTANVTVLLEDAPRNQHPSDDEHEDEDEDEDDEDDERPQPSIVKVFPGPEGWTGRPTSVTISTTTGLAVQLGDSSLLSVTPHIAETRTWTEEHAVRVKTSRRGSHRNTLLVDISEDSVKADGVPEFITIPLIITHHGRRFSMRVALHAHYGFWRGKLAETRPVLGRSDDPLFFDPAVMKQMMVDGSKAGGAELVTEWLGSMDELDLRAHSSLTGYTTGG